ncbi:rhodanese-like domain-containing protein [Streptomyces sp. NPDC056500]|uniref:rhodanese-like domain-containing protein n=1 Tax=Streptomyces sp. NPDC056500 TaxID=3345840 RepID=UPI003673D8D2
MTETAPSPSLRTPFAAPSEAAAFFAARLAFQTDVADVHASMQSADVGFVLVDSRGAAGWQQGHVPGAVHLPTADIPTRAADELDPAVLVVTYCWGPGCDGATRSALALAQLGYRVKEMIGGIEYWIREGFAVAGATGTEQRAPDPLTSPINAASCSC